jgi:hypothetical protein
MSLDASGAEKFRVNAPRSQILAGTTVPEGAKRRNHGGRIQASMVGTFSKRPDHGVCRH